MLLNSQSLVFFHLTKGGLGDLFVMLGRLFISGLTGLYVYLIVTKSATYQVSNPVLPTALCAGLGFVIGAIFMSVYGIAIDAILYCFCHDEKKNKVPIHCPASLKTFMANNAAGAVAKV